MKNYTLAIGITSIDKQFHDILTILVGCGIPADSIQLKNLTVLVGINSETADPSKVLGVIAFHLDLSEIRWLNICQA